MGRNTKEASCCCCDKCDDDRLECDGCCKCIPKQWCINLFDEDGDEVAGGRLLGDGTGYWTGFISCGGDTLQVTVEIIVEYSVCKWHVLGYMGGYPVIDSKEDVNPGECGTKSFTFDSPFQDCAQGDLVIAKREQGLVTFVETEDGCTDFWCSQCRCVYETLCVTIFEDGEETDLELPWNQGSRSWGDAYTTEVFLLRDPDTGTCILSTEFGDQVLDYGACGFELSVFDIYGDGITGSGKVCKCSRAYQLCCPDGGEVSSTLFLYFSSTGPDGGPGYVPPEPSCENTITILNLISLTPTPDASSYYSAFVSCPNSGFLYYFEMHCEGPPEDAVEGSLDVVWRLDVYQGTNTFDPADASFLGAVKATAACSDPFFAEFGNVSSLFSCDGYGFNVIITSDQPC